jgi:hypothetical protein
VHRRTPEPDQEDDVVNRLRNLVSAARRVDFADLKGDAGQTTPEWAIVVAFVLALAVAAFAMLGPIITSVMQALGDAIIDALP